MIRSIVLAILACCPLLNGIVAAEPVAIATLPNSADGCAGFFALAATGETGAALCSGGILRVWSIPSRTVIKEMDAAGREFYTVAISRDGKLFAAVDFSGLYTIWNIEDGRKQAEWKLPYYSFALSFSPDGTKLAATPAGMPVQIYDVASGKKLLELHDVVGGSQSAAFSADGKRIATADSDTVVRVYNASNGEILTRYTGSLMEPLAVAFSLDAGQVFTGGGDKVLVALDVSSGQVLRSTKKQVDPIGSIDVSADGAHAAIGMIHADNLTEPAPILIVETRTGETVLNWKPQSRAVAGRWQSNGHLLVAVASAGGLELWQLQ